MLQAVVCGYLGADAECKTEQGREFTTFRVAHSDRWTDANQQTHESTTWVDCIMSGHPNVAEYLKQGTLVYVSGHVKLRAYSSEKVRAFVAGMTISVVTVELLGGGSDAVPRRLYDKAGVMHEVRKYYFTDTPGEVLTNGRGKEFAVDDNGWVFPMEEAQQQILAQGAQWQGSVLHDASAAGDSSQESTDSKKTKSEKPTTK